MPDRRDRRRDTALALGIVAMLVVAVAVLLGPALAGDEVLIATDQLLLKDPWRAELSRDGPPTNAAPASDTFDIWEPQRQLFAEAATHGDLAAWNPYPSGGAPLAAEPSTGTLSPFQLVYVLLPDSYAPGLVKLLELVASAGFTFLFLRRVGLSRVAATIGGTIYALNGFQLVWTNWPQARLGAVIPALLWAVERLLQRRTPPDVALVAAMVALLVVEGFPAVGLAALMAAGAYVAVRVVATPSLRPGSWGWLRPLAFTGAGVGLGVGLAAVQLLPFLARLSELPLDHRDQTPADHLDSVAAVTLAAPNAFGAPQEGAVHLPGGSVDYVEALSYVGATACVLALVGLVGLTRRTGRRAVSDARIVPGVRLYAALAALVTLLLIFVGGPLLALAQQFPPLDMNDVGRLRALLALFLAVLAAFGAEAVLAPAGPSPPTGAGGARAEPLAPRPASPAESPPPGDADRAGRGPEPRRSMVVRARGVTGRRSLVQWGALGGVVVSGVALVVRFVLVASDGGYLAGARDDLLAAGAVAVVAAGAVLAARRWPVVRGPAVLVLGALVVGQGLSVWRTYLPSSRSDTYFPATETHRFLQDNLDHDRAATAGWTLIAGSTAHYRIRTASGHAFTQPTWQDLLEAVDPAAFSRSPTYSFLGSTAEVATSPVLDRLGTRYFVTSPDAAVLGAGTPPPLATATVTGAHAGAGMGMGAGRAPVPISLGPGDEATASLRARRLRGVSVHLVEPAVTRDTTAWLEVAARDGEGRLVGRGSRRIHGRLGPGPVTIPVAAEGATSDTAEDLTATVTLAADDGRMALGPTVDGSPAVGTVTGDDDLELVFSTHGQVYERRDALPRIRWADHGRLVPEAGERLRSLRAGVPDDTVLVEDPDTIAADDREPRGGSAEADVEVVDDGLGRVRVEVDAPRVGYLVLADAVQIGWRAEVDGEPVELHRADHALGAVVVPEGRHVVELTFHPEGLDRGRLVTAASLLVMVLLLLWPAATRFIRRRRAAEA